MPCGDHCQYRGQRGAVESAIHHDVDASDAHGHAAHVVAERRAAADLKGRDRLRAVAPSFRVLLERWALSGPSLGLQVTRAIKLLDLYGDPIFAAAVDEIVERGLRDVSALAVACDRRHRATRRPAPLDIQLPAHVVDRDVVPHALETYDDRDDQ